MFCDFEIRHVRRVAGLFLIFGASILLAQQPAVTPAVTIDQEKLEQGKYPLLRVLESGGQFFSVPYLPYDRETKFGDGYGEGPDGPRNAQRYGFYPEAYPDYHFLRLNGLDSQSCYECHNSIGTYHAPNDPRGMIRKPFPVGGSAGSNSNAFINPEFPYRNTYLVRNPPHVFGTGYTQSLAGEMTHELLLLREAARVAARKEPGQAKSIPLSAKGQSFGDFTTTYTGGAAEVVGCAPFSSGNPSETFGEQGFLDDYAQVMGVACDLIVRPFQWKGISSSVRHFARDALDFHLSMQAVEKYGHLDCDKDGKINEMTLGNVSALVAFVTMTRPPDQRIPKEKEKSVALGERIFVGDGPGLYGRMCATCHEPSLTLTIAVNCIDNPGVAQNPDCAQLESGLVSPLPAGEYPPVVNQYRQILDAIRQKAGDLESGDPQRVYQTLKQHYQEEARAALGNCAYAINLNQPGADTPNYALPRLKYNPDGSVDVPLFSDLRLHNMGKGLQDVGPQNADVDGVQIPAPLFVTRPLWGVGDTQPWIHDARALTLHDAILAHESEGSEANPVIAAFRKLDQSRQQAVVDFLLSLRLPQPAGPYFEVPPQTSK